MGPINLLGPANGGPADHQHDGYSHDETCLPARSVNIDDEHELTSFFGSSIGIASASKHHDENASHDDNCLLGHGCLGLGLDPGDGEKDTLLGAASSFPAWCPSFPAIPEGSVLDTSARAKQLVYFDPHQSFWDANPGLQEDGVPAPSPHISCELMSEGDAISEIDSRLCGSQCCGSSGSCSSGPSGPCGELLALFFFASPLRSSFVASFIRAILLSLMIPPSRMVDWVELAHGPFLSPCIVEC